MYLYLVVGSWDPVEYLVDAHLSQLWLCRVAKNNDDYNEDKGVDDIYDDNEHDSDNDDLYIMMQCLFVMKNDHCPLLSWAPEARSETPARPCRP